MFKSIKGRVRRFITRIKSSKSSNDPVIARLTSMSLPGVHWQTGTLSFSDASVDDPGSRKSRESRNPVEVREEETIKSPDMLMENGIDTPSHPVPIGIIDPVGSVRFSTTLVKDGFGVESVPTLVEIQEGTLSTASKPYTYSSIDSATGDIRVVDLLPGNFSDEIRIKIRKFRLSKETMKEIDMEEANPHKTNSTGKAPGLESKPSYGYEALSYAWGSAENRVRITIVDDRRNHFLEITKNLAAALSYLRHKYDLGTLWIDAICINQQDLAERSEQVMKMGNIYEWAGRVVVWLGPPNTDTEKAMYNLSDLGRRVTVNWNLDTMIWHDPICKPPPHMKIEPIDLRKNIPYKASIQLALASLLSREWFERLWVWQEIHLANSKSILLCGDDCISWDHFRNALYCLKDKMPLDQYTGYQTEKSAGTPMPFYLKQLVFSRLLFSNMHDHADIINISMDTKGLLCSDPRDRIYAIQGVLLQKQSDYVVLKPDYTPGSEVKVGMDFVLNYINCTRSLRILELCNLKQNHGNLPTWVPNFFTRDGFPSMILKVGYAAGGSAPEIRQHDEHKLKVKGLKCNSSIIAIEKIEYTIDEDLEVISLGVRRCWSLFRTAITTTFDLFEEQMLLFCAALISGDTNDFHTINLDTNDLEHQKGSSLSECQTFLMEILLRKDKSEKFSKGAEVFLQYLSKISIERCFFVTDDRRFGIGPGTASLGDSIYVLMGSHFPFVLRALKEGREHQIIGPCYCTGLMDGEAFLGPLPNHQKYILLDPVRLRGPAFVNTRTGERKYEDPRLGRPPRKWTRNKCGKEDWEFEFVHRDTGEIQRYDPRLTSTALSKRGIKIEDIILV